MGRSKAHKEVTIICKPSYKAQATTGSTFLIRLMHLILRFLPPPICFPQFPCQPSSTPCLSTSAWQEVGRTPPELEEGWATMSPLQQLAKCCANKCAVVIQPMVWYEVGWRTGEVKPCPSLVGRCLNSNKFLCKVLLLHGR